MSRRIVYALCLAIACLAVLATRVHSGFERIRFRVVTAPEVAHEPVMAVTLPDLTRLSGSPAAVIVRLRGTTEPTTVTITLDAAQVGQLTVPPGRELRLDAAAMIPTGLGHQLVLTGDRAGWQLAFLEFSNVFGFSHGTLKFVIVPREQPRREPVSAWILALLAVAAVAAQPRIDWLQRRTSRWLYRTAVGFALLILAVTLLADTFSRYRIILELETFLLCVAILYADPLVRLWRRAKPYVATNYPRAAPLLPHVAVAVLVLWSVGRFYHPDTGFTSLIYFGEDFEGKAIPALRAVPHAITEGSGYDGQFYAQLSLDPLLRSEAIVTALDNAAYRGRRILVPWAAHLIGFGQSWYVLQAYALMNVLCWAAFAVLLLRWLPPGAVRPAFAWTACVLSDGLMTSMRYSVPDGPSMLLLALSVAAVEHHRRGLAAGILGLAGLARETNVIGALVLAPSKATPRTVTIFLLHAALALIPLLLWVAYLWNIGLSAGSAGSRAFAMPFAGYANKWATTVHALSAEGWASFARFGLLGLVALTTQVLVLLWQRDWRNPWWRMGIAYAALMVMLGPAVWESGPGAVMRVVVPITIAFNVLLPKVRWFWPLWVLGNLSVLHGFDVMRMPWLAGW